MYIRGTTPQNLAELAEAVPIVGAAVVLWINQGLRDTSLASPICPMRLSQVSCLHMTLAVVGP